MVTLRIAIDKILIDNLKSSYKHDTCLEGFIGTIYETFKKASIPILCHLLLEIKRGRNILNLFNEISNILIPN